MAEQLETPKTLQAAVEFFSDEDRCHAYMVQMRWPDGRVTCPICNRPDPLYLTNQRRFKCRGKHPRAQFSVKVGTIFEGSPIALKSWLLAVWMITNCKNGISSYEIARHLGITQKTGWFMLHRIRLAMQSTQGGMLAGEVEVDETFIGGKARNMHKIRREKMRDRSWHGKAAVIGLLQRHAGEDKSKIRTSVVQTTRKRELHPLVEQHIEDGAKVYTDELRSYENLGVYYEHQVINHAETYVRGEVHTNGMENFWSLLKRSIHGTYVSVEPFHLFRYLDEQSFRFNEREGADGDRFANTLRHVVGRRVTYKELTGRPPAETGAI